MDEDFRRAALDYHRLPRPGKLQIEPTKRMATQRDLSLAYSPGVAAASLAIAADPASARDYTARGNLVAVISNGTAVLGLGNIGALAAKPVMEGKAVLFKKFAGIDVFDIEVDARDPEHFCDVVAALEPTFGAINLEDIKAPECFTIEASLRARMNIPVFHDDQHGTAITVAAAIRNGLLLQGKDLARVKLVTSGAGAAALACVDLLVRMGLPAANITLTDIKGVVHAGREGLDARMAPYARQTDARALHDVLAGADVFMGLSAPGVLKPEWLTLLADKPLILALANPDPEIDPEAVAAARPDAIMATGRSDTPNQVNNVLCFPFIFRGALDVGATTINEAMELAAVEAIAGLARVEASEVVAAAYGGAAPVFGPDYIIPKPFDPRLIIKIAPAVARAAMESGVATRPVTDFAAYERELERFVFRSGQLMRPVFAAARGSDARIVYAEGEDERVLRAVQTVLDEDVGRPILIGRHQVIEARVRAMGLRMDLSATGAGDRPGGRPRDLRADDRRVSAPGPAAAGTPPEAAARRLRTLPDDRRRDAAAHGPCRRRHLRRRRRVVAADVEYILPIVPKRPEVTRIYAISCLILQAGVLFICDTHMVPEPTAEQIAEMTVLAAEAVTRFGVQPKAALLSHSMFGASKSPSARKMRQALALIRARAPDLEVDGEMHADAALNEAIRNRMVLDSTLSGTANLLIMPGLDAANIAYNLLKAAADALPVGPLLLGMSRPIHVLVPSVTARGIANISAIAAKQAAAAHAQAPLQ